MALQDSIVKANALAGQPARKPMPYEVWLLQNGPERIKVCDVCTGEGSYFCTYCEEGRHGCRECAWEGTFECSDCNGEGKVNLTRLEYELQLNRDKQIT